MDEARAVLARLDQIEAMDRGGEPKAALLLELSLLISEARAWLAVERDPPAAAEDAVDRCVRALDARGPVDVRSAA